MLGNIVFPIFGGIIGYGLSNKLSNNLENYTEEKVKKNL